MVRSSSNGTSERAVLLGLLAWKLEYARVESILAALSAWELDPSESFTKVLQREASLSADQERTLDNALKQHLHLHGDDPRQSLTAAAAQGCPPELLPRVMAMPAELPLSVIHSNTDVPTLHSSVEPMRPVPIPVADQETARRYRLIQPLARGGIGLVHLAEDLVLHRTVALKEMQPKHAADAVSRERFQLEAEITGGLEHPGVVHVHNFGAMPDGRPFYTMQYVHGETMQRAIERYHAPDAPSDPHQRNLAFRELLGRFVAVCNSVAYAHSRGVLHRDLKPSNVMLGKFGQTLILDWGLARATGTALTGDGEEPPLRPSTGELLDALLKHQTVGTPGYMSPEQAASGASAVGPASDIYSLGVTLYVLLTGRLPFRGDVREVLDQAARGEFIAPEEANPDVPAALDAVCRKAMALQPGDRYSTVLALAEDVTQWLADEPVSVYRDSWSVQLARWVRFHRVVAVAVIAALVTSTAALIIEILRR